MIKDEIETILKQAGWCKTVSAPANVIDWQEREKFPYKRLILAPYDFKYITPEVLNELISSKVEFGSAEILERAKSEYEKKQMTLAGTTVAENGMEKQVGNMRDRLKKVIDDFPVEKLSTLADLIVDLYESEKAKPKQVETETEKKWRGRAEIAGGEELRVAVIEMATDEDATEMEIAFKNMQEMKYDYRSAVVVNNTIVRTVVCDYRRTVGGLGVMLYNTASRENAMGVVMLMDGVLRREAKIVGVTRAEKKLSVSYTVTGIKMKPKALPRKFTFEDTNGYELVDTRTGEPVFGKRKGGEGGESPFLKKRRRE